MLAGNRMLVMVASKNPELEQPGPDDLYGIGVVGSIARMLKVPDGTLRILVQGAQRVRLERFTQETPYLAAEITELPDTVAETPELTALSRNVQETFSRDRRGRSRTSPRSSSTRSRTSTTRAR